MSQRILVVDDDRSIVKVVKSYLEQAGYQVLTAHDGERALHIMRREHPDLLVLDLMLPDRDGWELTRLARSDRSLATMPIIMLTARVEDIDKIIGLEMGADDYITKPFNAREVVARVRALLRRSQLMQGVREIDAHVLTVSGLCLDLDQHLLTVDGHPVELTRTEFKLLHLLMANPGHTLARDELVEKIMGYAYEGMGRTLDTHVRNLRRKIEPDPNEPTYIQTVYGIGYRLARSAGII
ncbi:response regulator transcription factor [Chloroflexi bacterium TSY]|nr:response regulator transcription factor [Chloroflexi bacterium TSY]